MKLQKWEEQRIAIQKQEQDKYTKELKAKIRLVPNDITINKEMLDGLTIEALKDWRKENGYPEVDERWLWS